jgi:hypothetical protein
VYSKTCSYVLNTLPYASKTITVTASVSDTTGTKVSDKVTLNVVDKNVGGGGAVHPTDGKKLVLQIVEPQSGEISEGAVEIKLFADGPNSIGQMSLGIEAGTSGVSFPISNRNCMSGGGGGGSTPPSSCEKYFVCPDGKEVQYCAIQKVYDNKGNPSGAACGCKSDPSSLCTAPSSMGGGGSGEGNVPSSIGAGGGGGGATTSLICSGCVLGDKCVQVGYRNNNDYCNLTGEFTAQSKSESICNNNFECTSNICAAGKCVNPGLWEQILGWFKKLFGG